MVSRASGARLHVNSGAASDPGGIISNYSPRTDSDLQLPARDAGHSTRISSPPPTVNMTYSHISVGRSPHMEIQIVSPSVQTVRNEEHQSMSLPVFNGNERISGHVILGPTCHQSGFLSISIEGTFQYASPRIEATEDYSQGPNEVGHVFFFATKVIQVRNDTMSSQSSAFLHEPSTPFRRPSNMPSVRSSKSSSREIPLHFHFSFDIPPASQPGQKMPHTFSVSTLVHSGTRGRAFIEKTEVAYRVTALWEPTDGNENGAFLEMPIIFKSDNDPRSLNLTIAEPEFWLEIPLTSERKIPFQCAVTLPSPGNFSRSSFVPFYVVFTTAPKASALAREIATDATITVSLVREVTVSAPSSSATSPPVTPSSLGNISDSPSSHQSLPRRKLFNRVTQSAPTVLSRAPCIPEDTTTSNRDKPLPFVPSNESAFRESRTLQTDICVGFPKRPSNRKHPQEPSIRMAPDDPLPDGLYKGKLQLNSTMFPGINWYNVSVKYYLDISVIFRQDEARARIPIRVY